MIEFISTIQTIPQAVVAAALVVACAYVIGAFFKGPGR